MAPGVRIKIASKRFGDAEALFSGFTLDIAPGSVVALLGPSGIGKSSLLRLVSGIDPDFSGDIDIGGQSAAAAPMPGFVFQDPRLLPWLTARGNVGIAAPDMTSGGCEALLAQVGLEGRGGDFPAQLSGGMQRRVALARALAANPALLLLDEPFVSLDAALAADMRALVAQVIARNQPTMLLVTHDIEDALALADRVVVLAGRPVRIERDVALGVPRGERRGEALDPLRQRLMSQASAH